jgi:hypothetical protein
VYVTLQNLLGAAASKRGSSSASGAGEHACFAAPLVLFLPEAEAHALKHAAVPVDQWGTEYLVAGRSSLDDMLESALRWGLCH